MEWILSPGDNVILSAGDNEHRFSECSRTQGSNSGRGVGGRGGNITSELRVEPWARSS